MRRILVTGGSGLMGRYLDRIMDAEFTWYTAKQPWTRHHMGVGDRDEIARVFAKVKPTHVVHMASVGDVDWCERNYGHAEKVIVRGTTNVLMEAREYGAKFVYVSTNAVFGGDDPPYAPDSERRPVNRYGAFRRRAEDIVAGYGHGWAVVRLFLLYGWQPRGARDNWATRLIGMLGRKKRPSLVDDRWWQPTYAGHAAQALASLIDSTGMWHVMGGDRVTLFQFGEAVAGVFGFGADAVDAVHTGDLPTVLAPRPVDTSYDTAAGSTFVVPGIRAGLASMLAEPCGHKCGIVEGLGWVPEAGCPVHD